MFAKLRKALLSARRRFGFTPAAASYLVEPLEHRNYQAGPVVLTKARATGKSETEPVVLQFGASTGKSSFVLSTLKAGVLGWDGFLVKPTEPEAREFSRARINLSDAGHYDRHGRQVVHFMGPGVCVECEQLRVEVEQLREQLREALEVSARRAGKVKRAQALADDWRRKAKGQA